MWRYDRNLYSLALFVRYAIKVFTTFCIASRHTLSPLDAIFLQINRLYTVHTNIWIIDEFLLIFWNDLNVNVA